MTNDLKSIHAATRRIEESQSEHTVVISQVVGKEFVIYNH